jgi:hypothetical protein
MATRAKPEMMYVCGRLLRIVRLPNLPVSLSRNPSGMDHLATEDIYA